MKDGVPLEQIEVIGTGQASNDAARVLAVGPEAAVPAQPASAVPDEPLGDAYFLTEVPLDIERDHSAMVNVLSSDVHAETVYFYDQSRRAAPSALRSAPCCSTTRASTRSIRGPSPCMPTGSSWVKGLSDPIQPKGRAFVPFSLDRKLLVEEKDAGREEIDRLVTAERGVLTTEARRIKTTELELVNRGLSPVTVYVRHALADGYQLSLPAVGVEKFRDAYLIGEKSPRARPRP